MVDFYEVVFNLLKYVQKIEPLQCIIISSICFFFTIFNH